METRARTNRLVGVLAVAAGAMTLGPATGEAGGPINPKPGSYAGAGFLEEAPSFSAQIGFTFQGGQLETQILGFAIPGCSGFVSVPPTPVTENRFNTSSIGPNSEENLFRGHWISRRTVKGKLTLSRPDDLSCGDPGTYVYRYTARRYGRP